jgi:hypothetical protein
MTEDKKQAPTALKFVVRDGVFNRPKTGRGWTNGKPTWTLCPCPCCSAGIPDQCRIDRTYRR